MKKYVLAIDQGTTSTRAILFDKKQRIVASEAKSVKNIFKNDGWVEMDANEIWTSVLGVIADIFQNHEMTPSEVAAIGISNQRETTIVWDRKSGLPVYNAIVWQSRQTSAIVERYKKMGVEELIKAKTGLILDPYFSATKIRWILENVKFKCPVEDLMFGTVETWLLYKMTLGKVILSDVTNASRTLLFNIHTLKWDDELLKLFEIPETMLPEITDNAKILGYIDPNFFFNESVPIASIIGDQQASLFGQSCFEKGAIKNTYGTGGFLLMNTKEEIVDSKDGLLTTVGWCIGEEVTYALEGSIFTSGSLLQWLRDSLHLFKDVNDTEKIAASVPSSQGVIIVPAFVGMGAPYWKKEARGMIFNLKRDTDYRHIIRAALEAMAYEAKDLIDIMQSASNTIINDLKVDGGASKNNFLLQFQSDILNMNVIRNKVSESTALGAARLAGLAVGFYEFDDFKYDDVEIFRPKMSKEEADKLYEGWLKAVKACVEY